MSGRPVILDPDALENFAKGLKDFNSQLASSTSRLNGQFRQLGETWRDPAYATFAREFEQTIKSLRRFQETAEDVVPKLLDTARRAREVHSRRW